ncbi:MAG: hypothetical protein ACUVR0_08820 [Candidatus Aminicenantales bacterium]
MQTRREFLNSSAAGMFLRDYGFGRMAGDNFILPSMPAYQSRDETVRF